MSTPKVVKLIPTSVTLESSLKIFSKDSGFSDGGSVTVTFDLAVDQSGGGDQDPAEMRKLVTKAILEEKYRLDQLCLLSERAKGMMQDSVFEARKQMLKRNYERILGGLDGSTEGR